MDKIKMDKHISLEIPEGVSLADIYINGKLYKQVEPAPPRNLLAVDENTPVGTWCYVNKYGSSPTAQRLAGFIDGHPKTFYGVPDNIERFVGINLLPNPGYDEPPVDGLVLCIFRGDEIGIREAKNCRWTHKNDYATWDIVQFAPVAWKDGQLVIRWEALR